MATSEGKGEGLPQLRDLHEALPAAEDTRPFTQPWDFGDITFIIEGRKMYVNKTTLSMSSAVFKAMFTSEFAEKKMTEILLPDKKFDDFLQLMQILHPHINKWVTDTNVNFILPLAHEYLIHHVIECCVTTLLAQPPSIHNLILADKFSLAELRQVCIDYVKRAPHSKNLQDPAFKMLEKETLFEIFQHKTEVYEGKDPSKNACNLVSQPPSIRNLILAKKYEIPEVYEKCLQYITDTPLAQLKQEEGFTNLDVDTLNEVLTHKYEALHTVVSKKVSWGQQVVCHCRHFKGTNRGCPECKKCSCTSSYNHQIGTDRGCLACNKYMFDEICEVVKKY